jgi:hypothetical protein
MSKRLPITITTLLGFGAAGCVGPAEPPSQPLPVPFVVSDYYSPDGHFGDGEKRGFLEVEKQCPNRAPGGRGDCYTVTYRVGDKRFAGVFWQHPHNNWGFWPGHKIAAGAKKVSFRVRGQKGGEVVSFGAGQKGEHEHNDNFKLEEVTVGLTTSWEDKEIPFRGMSYDGPSGVLGAFLISMSAPADADAMVFYLDDIRWVP